MEAAGSVSPRRHHRPQPRAEQGTSAGDGSPRHRDMPPPDEGQQGTNKVYVSGFPQTTKAEDLGQLFKQFGRVNVEKFNMRLSYAVLHFNTEKEAMDAVKANKKIQIFGDYLYTRPYTLRDSNNKKDPKRDFTRSKQKNVIIEPKKIDLNGEFLEQVERILGAVRLTQEEATTISTLYADVERVLQAQWPGCKAMPFGSITTGLGIKTSDADCYVHVPPAQLQRISGGGATLVNRAKRVLQSYPQIFAEILAIPRANTPIVKFFHLPTATNCDLSFKTPLGVQNSRLVGFLLNYDARFLPFAVVAKYWAKAHGLSGTGRLTNYALCLMLIFFLQQPPLSILPTIESLQKDAKNDVIVDYWNTGFLEERDDNESAGTNTSSLSELLGGFFEFYAQFNFDEMVVCPYLGRPVKKEEFQDLNLLPEGFERYKDNVSSGRVQPMRINTAMVVQDPFEQCHNVACAISIKLAAEIQAYFKFAAAAYEKEKLNGCRDLLKIILLQKPKNLRKSSHPEYRFNIFPKVIQCIIDDDWKSIVRNLILKMFEDMLKIELKRIDSKRNNADLKKEREKYNGTITKAVWKRKKFSKLYSVLNMDFVEKQTKITDEVLNVEKENINLNFTLTLSFVNDPKCSSVWMKLAKGDAALFSEFGKFFVGSMYPWFTAMLKPHMQDMPSDPAADLADTIDMIDGNLGNNNLDSDDDDASTNVDSANNTNSSNELADRDNDDDD